MGIARSTLLARLPVLAVGAMVVVALAGAIAGRVTGAGNQVTQGTQVASRNLRFEDRADGAVMIFDAGSTTPFEVVEGQNGFLRGALRGLARTRRSEGLDDSVSFHLAAWSDGRLTLDDPATGRHVELEAFGPTNEAVFAHMLPGLGGGA